MKKKYSVELPPRRNVLRQTVGVELSASKRPASNYLLIHPKLTEMKDFFSETSVYGLHKKDHVFLNKRGFTA